MSKQKPVGYSESRYYGPSGIPYIRIYEPNKTMTPEEHKKYLKELEKKNDTDARELQKKLKKAGLYEGKIDGIIGPKTKEALEKYEYLQNNKATEQTVNQTKRTFPSIIPTSASMFLNNMVSAPIERLTGINLGKTYNKASIGTQNKIEEMTANKMIERFGSIEKAKQYFEQHPEEVIQEAWQGRNFNNKKGFSSDYQKHYGKSYDELTSGSARAKALVGDNLSDAANSIGSANMFASKYGVRIPDNYDFMGKKADNSIWDALKSGQPIEALRIAADRYGSREGVDNTTTKFDTSIDWNDLMKYDKKEQKQDTKQASKQKDAKHDETPAQKAKETISDYISSNMKKYNIKQSQLDYYKKTYLKNKNLSNEEVLRRYINGLKSVHAIS